MRLLLSRLTLLLFAGALALRIVIAPGLMPSASAHGVHLTVCAGPMGGHHDGQPAMPCPFEAVAAPAVPAAAPVTLARALLPAPAPVVPPALTQRAQGPPAPHPPATGPPAIA